jgi:hypothetical protein
LALLSIFGYFFRLLCRLAVSIPFASFLITNACQASLRLSLATVHKTPVVVPMFFSEFEFRIFRTPNITSHRRTAPPNTTQTTKTAPCPSYFVPDRSLVYAEPELGVFGRRHAVVDEACVIRAIASLSGIH